MLEKFIYLKNHSFNNSDFSFFIYTFLKLLFLNQTIIYLTDPKHHNVLKKYIETSVVSKTSKNILRNFNTSKMLVIYFNC